MQFSEMQTKTKRLCSINNTTYDDFIDDNLNFGQQDFARDVNWQFSEFRGSTATIAYKYRYTMPANFDVVKGVIYKMRHHLQPVNYDQWLRLNKYDSVGTPQYYIYWDGDLCLYPSPGEAGTTETIDGALTTTQTTMRLDSLTDLKPRGKIGLLPEVVDYVISSSSDKELYITRGAEETTARIHADGTTAVYHNLEYHYYKTLSDLSATADVSEVPVRYHEAMPLFAASRFFEKTEDLNMANRLRQEYEAVKAQAKKDLGEKSAQKFTTTLDDTSPGYIYKGNEYPDDGSLSATHL